MQRIPRVCIITVGKDSVNTFDLLYVSLETALLHPFREKTEEEKEEHTSQDVNRLIQMIETSEIDVVDIKKALPIMAKEFGHNKIVLDKAFEFLEKV